MVVISAQKVITLLQWPYFYIFICFEAKQSPVFGSFSESTIFFWYLLKLMQSSHLLSGCRWWIPRFCDICLIHFGICLIYFIICQIYFDISENSYCGRVLTCWVVAGDKSPAFSKSSHHFLLEATPQSRQLFL